VPRTPGSRPPAAQRKPTRKPGKGAAATAPKATSGKAAAKAAPKPTKADRQATATEAAPKKATQKKPAAARDARGKTTAKAAATVATPRKAAREKTAAGRGETGATDAAVRGKALAKAGAASREGARGKGSAKVDRKAPGKARRKQAAAPRAVPAAGGLTVAVTGPTGTFGAGLVPLLEREPRVGRVVGIARRPFRPADHGWSKMTYRRGDVRDADALREAFQGVDAVVHLAFVITGNASRRTIREINVDGTLHAFRAAAASGVRRFVYASSVAAYGFHGDNPIGMTEDWPVRPADRLFYAREKAELEQALAEEARRHPGLDLYLLRPSVVVGPNVLGGKTFLPGFLSPLNRFVPDRPRRLPVPVVLPVPLLTMQLVHESDVGQALLLCALGDGPPGAYNIAGDGTVTAADVARAFGIVPVPLPAGPVRGAARLVSRLPLLPPAAEWAEAAGHPSIMDTTRAKTRLGWTPRYTAEAALRDTVT
jgi:nucleoside-diphosphate-sugar epimerase